MRGQGTNVGWVGLSIHFLDWRLIWTNELGRGYQERAELCSRIYFSAEVDKDQITVGGGGWPGGDTFSEI